MDPKCCFQSLRQGLGSLFDSVVTGLLTLSACEAQRPAGDPCGPGRMGAAGPAPQMLSACSSSGRSRSRMLATEAEKPHAR